MYMKKVESGWSDTEWNALPWLVDLFRVSRWRVWMASRKAWDASLRLSQVNLCHLVLRVAESCVRVMLALVAVRLALAVDHRLWRSPARPSPGGAEVPRNSARCSGLDGSKYLALLATVAESWSMATFLMWGSLVSARNLNTCVDRATWDSSSTLGMPMPPRACRR